MTTPGIFASGKLLQVNEVETLLKRGLSPGSSGTGRRAGRTVVSLSGQDVAALEARFISLRELALALRLSWESLDARLAEHGIAPFSGGSRGFRKIYARAAVGTPLRGCLIGNGSGARSRRSIEKTRQNQDNQLK